MPPPLAPSKRQIVAWVDEGIITPEQAVQMMRPARRPKAQAPPPSLPAAQVAPAPPSPPTPRRGFPRLAPDFLGPSPLLRDAIAPLAGVGLALLLAIALVAADTFVDSRSRLDPGDVLLIGTGLLTAALGALAYVAAERRRPVFGAAALTLLALIVLLHPQPPQWTLAAPALSLACLLTLAMRPATRVVAAVPCLWALLVVVMDLLAAAELQTIATLLVAGLYVHALAFALPFESGWRRIPFGVQAVAIVLLLATVAGLLLSAVASGSEPHFDVGNTVLGLVGCLLYAATVWFGWTDRRLRGFALPTLAASRNA